MNSLGTSSLWGTMLGMGLGMGLVLIWVVAESHSKPLVSRIRKFHVPRVEHVPVESAEPVTGVATVQRLVKMYVGDLERLLSRIGSSKHQVLIRQRQAGLPESVVAFRVEQVVWGVGAMAVSLALVLIGAVGGRGHLAASLILIMISTVLGLLIPDWRLTRAARNRCTRIVHEFPTVAELLALSVAAGEAPMSALSRVVELTDSSLTQELRHVLHDVRGGTRLTDALHAMSQRLDIGIISRFAEAIATALDRGTPLVAVLHDQARDARSQQHHQLMESGGKKELAMMVPLVFLILPITVVFALFPGLITLQISL